jgi:hypothetical protein
MRLNSSQKSGGVKNFISRLCAFLWGGVSVAALLEIRPTPTPVIENKLFAAKRSLLSRDADRRHTTRAPRSMLASMVLLKSGVLAMLLLLAGCGGSTAVPRSGVVFVGDSIFGRLVTDSAFTNAGNVNGGMFGYRTDQILALMPNILSGQQVCHGLSGNDEFPLTCATVTPPKTIVVFAGWNNMFQGQPGKLPLDDLKAIVAMAHAQGVRVVICTVYAYDPGHPAPWMVPTGNAPVTYYDGWREPINDGIRAMKDVSVVDLSGVFAAESFYTVDGVHPTDAGNEQMLSAIMQKL